MGIPNIPDGPSFAGGDAARDWVLPEAVIAELKTREETRRALFKGFAQDVRRRLEEDDSPSGRMLFHHIRRQLDLVSSEQYTRWFRDVGERSGFEQETVLAAVAGSDVTKVTLFSEAARKNFGTTAEHVQALAARNDLRYGRVFAEYTPLENLYLHAEGGRHYTLTELTRQAALSLEPFQAERVALVASEAILGHDSFNAGFGQHRLKAFLAAKYHEPVEAFNYPTAQTPAGFLVQVLDRLEGCDPDTMLRYVTEGVNQRRETITQAIKTGLIDNYAFLRENYERLINDAREVLTPSQARVLLESPPMRDFAQGLQHIPGILAHFGTPPSPDADGFYYLTRGIGRVRLDCLEAFGEYFPAACGKAQIE
jgi:hypothetical protein